MVVFVHAFTSDVTQEVTKKFRMVQQLERKICYVYS